MTVIAPPAPPIERDTRTTNRTTRVRAAARRGAVALTAAIVLTVLAQFTLADAATTSAVVAAATASGVAALLSFVVVGSIWSLTSAYHPLVGGLAAASLGVGSAIQLYAVLALLLTGTSGVARFNDTWAMALLSFGVHLLLLSATLLRCRALMPVPVAIGVAGVAILAAVLPPGWFPQTTHAVLALAAGQTVFLGWLVTCSRSGSRPQTPAPPPRHHYRGIAADRGTMAG